MPRAMSSGNAIAYDDVGKGEPALLFLPGWCANRNAFEDILPLAAKHRRCLALDWRGHGQSSPPPLDFDQHALVDDAMAVLAATGTHFVVPVATSHTGWVALELRRRLRARVPAVVLIDWLLTDPPAAYLKTLDGLQSAEHWREWVEKLFASWLAGAENPRLTRFVREGMGAYGFEMWSRAARSIGSSYAEFGCPLKAMAQLTPSPLMLHLYATPPDPDYLAVQQAFAAEHPWFCVRKLAAKTHFPMFEVPEAMVAAIEEHLA